MRNPKSKKKIEMDKCVICGKDTKYPKDMHIAYRFNYIEGAGQICDDCANLQANNERKYDLDISSYE